MKAKLHIHVLALACIGSTSGWLVPKSTDSRLGLPRTRQPISRVQAMSHTKEPVADAPTLQRKRDLLAFTLPALGIYVAGPILSLIDAGFVGRCATNSLELASLGPATVIVDTPLVLLLFISISTTNMVSAAGSDDDRAAKAVATALALAALAGCAIAALQFSTAAQVSAWYTTVQGASGTDAKQLASFAESYVKIRALGAPFALVGSVAQAACLGFKDTTTPMKVIALASVVNVAGDWLLIKSGVGGFATAGAGAAAATVFAQVGTAVALLQVLRPRLECALSAIRNGWQPLNIQNIMPFAAFAPFIFVSAMKLVHYNGVMRSAALVGGADAAAHVIVFSVAIFSFVVGDVCSSITQAFIPPYYSEHFKNKDKRRTSLEDRASTAATNNAAQPMVMQILRVALSLSSVCAAAAFAVVSACAKFMTDDPLVSAASLKLRPWIVAVLSLHATAIAMEGALLARRDLRFLCGLYAGLGALLVYAFTFVNGHGLGLNGVWTAMVSYQFIRIAMLSWRGNFFR